MKRTVGLTDFSFDIGEAVREHFLFATVDTNSTLVDELKP